MHIEISPELKSFIAGSTIETVYFTADGNHHLSAYTIGDKLYAPGAISQFNGAHKPDLYIEKYEIVAIASRADILGEEDVPSAVAHTFGPDGAEVPAAETETQRQGNELEAEIVIEEIVTEDNQTKTGTEVAGPAAETETQGEVI